jgi:aspartyl-tRNA(Asn)/glutamyl-tRNA(Gln) amidotransferase subunit C
MNEFNKENIKDLQKLARLKLDENEIENFTDDLKKILNYIEVLSNVDTKNVSCCNNVSQIQIKNIFREDEVTNLLERDTFLENSPDKIAGMVRVPSIMKN